MPLEQQVSNRELSQKLRDLGVKQESYFWWELEHSLERATVTQHCPAKVVPRSYYDGTSPKDGFVSAFTVAELGEMLPDTVLSGRGLDGCGGPWWCARFSLPEFEMYSDEAQEADTEADARAKMLIYLLENKLITL